MIDLKFDRVSKRYRVQEEEEQTADGGGSNGGGLVRKIKKLRQVPKDFWALRDVSFEVRRGEALGIIGHNGAGKSTILKLISNITAPTSGEIMINGRLSALIEVGSGFHPELTGRENVYLNGSILGMRRREITAKLDSIIDFAGVRQFIDVPVKRYSSGMYVRLGFSIAAHLEPDVLLLDEVLAVGDAAFQAKCFQRIDELKKAQTTIVFISHDLASVERLCDRVVLMQRGQIAAEGRPREVIAEYQAAATNFKASAPAHVSSTEVSKKAETTGLTFHNLEGAETDVFTTGSPLTARLKYTAHEPVREAMLEIFFYSADGNMQCQLTTSLGNERIDLEPGTGTVEFFCPELGLQPGVYYIDTTILDGSGLGDWQYRCARIRVDPGKIVRGMFYSPHEWRFTERNSQGAERLGEFASQV